MPLHFRRATPADAAQVLLMLQDIAAIHHQGRPDIYREGIQKYSSEEFAAILQNADTPVFIAADENDAVAGYIFAEIRRYRNHPYFTDRTELYIDDFCVRAQSRGQRIGSQLFAYVKQYAQAEGIDFLYLNVWEFNESAIRFYESLGMTTRQRYMELKLK